MIYTLILSSAKSLEFFRGSERIISILIAGLLIYLGYLLFLKLPDKTDSSGKVILPGNISVFLSRVGPGAFFALFGSVILVYSLINPLTIKQDDKEVQYSQDPQSNVAAVNIIPDVTYTIESLKQIENLLITGIEQGTDVTIDNSLAVTLINSIPRMKYAIMLCNWDDSWGEKSMFIRWYQDDQTLPPPVEISNAVNIYKLNP